MTFAPLQLAPATIAGVLYAVRAHHLAQRGKAVALRRQCCFYGGLALIVVSLTSLGDLAGETFVAHMSEHLLIGDLAPLLLVLGLTGPLLAPLLRLRLLGPLRMLTHPLVALPLWALDLYVWHVPLFHEAAVRHETVHAVQHGLFIVCGVLMWMPLFGPLPTPAWFGNLAKLCYIIAVRLLGGLLGNVLLWSGTVLYPVYGEPLSDQTAAAAIMMIESSLVTIGLFGWLFLRAARESEERQELLELAAARGVELSQTRAARAVSAGRGDELRRRIEAGTLTAVAQPGTNPAWDS
ncbi:MAG: cytochrome c oxidase assembly protein [Candidatus Binatia bacterium]